MDLHCYQFTYCTAVLKTWNQMPHIATVMSQIIIVYDHVRIQNLKKIVHYL